MKLHLLYQINAGASWAPQYVYNQVDRLLREKFLDIEFVSECAVPDLMNEYPSAHVMTILNKENDKRTYLSYMDKSRFMLVDHPRWGWHPETIQQMFVTPDIVLLRQVMKEKAFLNKKRKFFVECGNRDIHYIENYEEVFQPFSYTVNTIDFAKVYAPRLSIEKKQAKDRQRKMVFRGYLWEPRQYICESGTHDEITCTSEYFGGSRFAEDMITNRCGLSLNGNAEICNRDMEYFALGMPLLRPTLKYAEFADPLIPDVHYIAFDYDREDYHGERYMGSPRGYNTKLAWDALVDRWEQVKDDYDYLEYVGENALKWYLKNAELDAQATYFVNNVNLSLLA